MKHEYNDTIPEGLMDRIDERLRGHTALKNKKHKIKIITFIVAAALLLPVSVYGVVKMDWGWARGIGIAENNGKSINLNIVFEDGESKVTFKNAVWEENMLLISFSTSGDGYIPGTMALMNENGEIISNSAPLSVEILMPYMSCRTRILKCIKWK